MRIQLRPQSPFDWKTSFIHMKNATRLSPIEFPRHQIRFLVSLSIHSSPELASRNANNPSRGVRDRVCRLCSAGDFVKIGTRRFFVKLDSAIRRGGWGIGRFLVAIGCSIFSRFCRTRQGGRHGETKQRNRQQSVPDQRRLAAGRGAAGGVGAGDAGVDLRRRRRGAR
jgi:hypothetical protein